jgi:hypothetical protein
MSAQPGDQHWFISLNGKRYGPYTFAALSEAAAKGVIDANTSVWRLGWVKWHPARRVPGLIEEEPPPEPLDQASDQESQEGEGRPADATDPPQQQDGDIGAEAPRRQGRPSNEVEQVAKGQWQRRVEDDLAEAPRRRKSQATEDENAEAPRRRKQAVEDRDAANQDAANQVPRRRKSQAAEEENAPVGGALRARPPSEDDEGDDNVVAPPIGDRAPNGVGRRTEEGAVPHVEVRDRLALSPPRQAGGFAKSAAIGVLAVTVLAGVGLFYSGMIVMVEPRRTTASVESPPPPPATPEAPLPVVPELPPPAGGVPGNLADGGGLPDVVAALPAVIALQRNDPAAFARFSKRFAESAANAPRDALASVARAALRKSVKRRLANSSADALLEITEVYLAYMQALQTLSPESCVALSDESKGANLTVNLAQQLPALFGREMAVLERVASTDSAIAALTADKAKPYLDKVYAQLLKQPLQIELLGRGTLVESEFTPYCALVIAFYKGVLTLPPDDKVNLLRYLYTAAIDPDDEK